VDIHKPKAAHSWREFAIEIGTIITGILIALGLEQAVEAYHWGRLVDEGRAELRSEVAEQAREWVHRLAIHPCAVRRLDETEALLDELDAGRRVGRVAPFDRPFGARMPEAVWSAVSASGVLAHMDPKQTLAFSEVYAQADEVGDFNRANDVDWSTIHLVVGDPNRLTPADRSQIRIAINRERTLETVWRHAGEAQRERSRAVGVAFPTLPDVSGRSLCRPLLQG
jgi:hypothetical protein